MHTDKFRFSFLGLISLIVSISLPASLLSIQVPTQAEENKPQPSSEKNCIPLKEVTTDQTQIRKIISRPTLGGVIKTGNYNTDFVVPTGQGFQYFVAVMTPENEANYEVTINLKYPNGTYDTPFTRNVPMTRDKTYSLPFQSGTERQPYQVNFRIGGSENNAYTISVLGCM